MHADVYVYDGGRFHMVVIGDETYFIEDIYSSKIHPLDQLLAEHGLTGKSRWRNGAPPGQYGDYRWGCWRHTRPVQASLDRPCCEEAAAEIYTWWDEIKSLSEA